MEANTNNLEHPLTGRWDLRDISITADGGWQVQRSFAESEHVWIFTDDGKMSSVANGKIVRMAAYWCGMNSMLLDLDGNRLDDTSGRFLPASEQYRVFFNGPDELFLYDTEPDEEVGGSYKRYRFMRYRQH